jgi:hypothetical protein
MSLLSPFSFFILHTKSAVLSLPLFTWKVFRMATEQVFVFYGFQVFGSRLNYTMCFLFLFLILMCDVLWWSLDILASKMSVSRLDDLDLIPLEVRSFLCHHIYTSYGATHFLFSGHWGLFPSDKAPGACNNTPCNGGRNSWSFRLSPSR